MFQSELWNNVSTADCASPGLTPDDFLEHQLWLQGPVGLSMDEVNWEVQQNPPANVEQPSEERTVEVMYNVTQQHRTDYS